jgi:hypothetical protein
LASRISSLSPRLGATKSIDKKSSILCTFGNFTIFRRFLGVIPGRGSRPIMTSLEIFNFPHNLVWVCRLGDLRGGKRRRVRGRGMRQDQGNKSGELHIFHTHARVCSRARTHINLRAGELSYNLLWVCRLGDLRGGKRRRVRGRGMRQDQGNKNGELHIFLTRTHTHKPSSRRAVK